MDEAKVKSLSDEMLNSPARRSAEGDLSDLIRSLKKAAERGQLTKEELVRICYTKSPRRAARSDLNDEGVVKRVTQFAFSETDPSTKVRLLCVLDGVKIPTASAILAWTRPDKWPVIDQRAWSALEHREIVQKRKKSAPLTCNDWVTFLGVVRLLEHYTGWQPQEIDHWLYWSDKNKDER